MNISGTTNNQIYNSNIPISTARNTTKNDFAITEVDKRSNGDIIGLTMVPEEYNGITYGMVAIWPSDFRTDNPVIQVASNVRGENHVYNIEISKIDPENATEMEMFALCSYADKIGKGTGSTFGSYQTMSLLRTYGNIVDETSFDTKSTWNDFQNAKKNWVTLCSQMVDYLGNTNNIDCFDLMIKGKKLLNFLSNQKAEI